MMAIRAIADTRISHARLPCGPGAPVTAENMPPKQ